MTEQNTSDPRGSFAEKFSENRRRVVMLTVVAAAVLSTILALGFSSQLLAATGPTDGPSSGASPMVTQSDDTSPTAEPEQPPSSSELSSHLPAEDQTSGKDSAPNGAPVPDAATPQHLSYPDAGLNMAVLPLTPSPSAMSSQSLVPPLTESAYWITAYGKPGAGSQNTTYITGHSWEDRPAPFNRLSSEAEVGDTLTLTTAEGELTYIVDSVTTHDKNTLKNSDIWNIVPQRLVLISCYTEDLWGKNVVVTASPTDSP